MKINKINEAIDKLAEVEDKLQGVVDPVMADAKIQSEINDEEAEKAEPGAEEFDRKKEFLGAEKQPEPEKAEKELEKIKLEEGLFEDYICEASFARDLEDIVDELDIQVDTIESPSSEIVKVYRSEPFTDDELEEIDSELPYAESFEVSEDKTEITISFDPSVLEALNEENDWDLPDDEVAKCEWCEEETPIDELVKTDMGWICPYCIQALNSRGEQYIVYHNADYYDEHDNLEEACQKEDFETSGRKEDYEFLIGQGLSPEEAWEEIAKYEYADDLEEDYDNIETFCAKDMENGNAFWILGYTANAMKECGMIDEIGEMRTEAMSGDYDNLCAVCNNYIQKCNEYIDTVDDDYQVEGLEFVTAGLDIEAPTEELQLPEIGARLRIISMDGEPDYDGKEGEVLDIDDLNQIHGTWGGLAIIPEVDKYEVI